MIEGAGILLVGMFIGWVTGRRGRKAKAPKPVRAICSCGHPRGKHVDGKAKCKASKTREIYKAGFFDHLERVECDCQQYDGPEPLPTMFAPEIEGDWGEDTQ